MSTSYTAPSASLAAGDLNAGSALPLAFLLVAAFLFQNMFVAMLSPTITSPEDFNLVRGHNFILLVSVWSVVLLGVLVSHRRLFNSERVLLLSTALLPLIAVSLRRQLRRRLEPQLRATE